MAAVNKVIILGNLGRDPEVKTTNNGKKVASFPVAVSEKYNGNEQTEWFNVVLWGKLADVAENYLHKGNPVYIEGKQQTRSWEDQDGVTKYRTELVGLSLQLLGSKSDNEGF